MASYYTYLISSLPVLSFGEKPPFSKEEFLRRCEGAICGKEIRLLASVMNGEQAAKSNSIVLKGAYHFDSALRNELVRLRAVRKKIDPHRYLRGEDTHDAHIAGIATSAIRNPSILEAEKALDLARWQSIDDLARRRYFDLEVLLAYALKLSIMLRWDKILSADKGAALARAVSDN
ncbi:MAG: DUF2764 family protein [Candidatus Omnitrophota bacterium]|jgi:hypothetical protein